MFEVNAVNLLVNNINLRLCLTWLHIDCVTVGFRFTCCFTSRSTARVIL